ncbi:MAG: purine-binding chemotaxis protein CheW [Deltaproteobacteria bacterium]|nr:purine-binding chemotaxis protein CheW [Deltaproteobacteria bacterium]MCW5806325.1 purine-binding chemotaxis protein CheW [Deltaproteobacteria bacterium]
MVEPSGHRALQLVCFELRGQELALPIAEVRETLPMQPITRVVLTPPCLAGVFSLRGDIVPAIDLAVLLGLPRTEVADGSRIVVLDRTEGMAGIVVDRLRDMRRIEEPLEPPPPTVTAAVASMLLGVAVTQTGTVRVLDARAVLTAEPLRALANEKGKPS